MGEGGGEGGGVRQNARLDDVWHLELVEEERFVRRKRTSAEGTHLKHPLWLRKVVAMEHLHVRLHTRENGRDKPSHALVNLHT